MPRAHTCRTGLAQRRFQERGRLFLGDEAVGVLETGKLRAQRNASSMGCPQLPARKLIFPPGHSFRTLAVFARLLMGRSMCWHMASVWE